MKSIKITLLGLVAALLLPCLFADAQDPTSTGPAPKDRDHITPEGEKARIERLAGLAKVWGEVKFFHPYLADREIDWDHALVETIPRVNAARTPEEYKAAVNHMLSFLNDQNTYAEIPAKKENQEQSQSPAAKIEAKDLVRLQDGVLIVEAARLAQLIVQEGTYDKANPSIAFLKQAQSEAKAIVWDCRTDSENFWYLRFVIVFNDLLGLTLADLLDTNLTLGTSRYRVHNGYPPQQGFSSGGYYSGFFATTPSSLSGHGKAKPPPMIFLTNNKVGDLTGVFSGLQTRPQVLIVQEGATTKEPGISPHEIVLPEGVNVEMRLTELVVPDGSIGFEPDVVVAKSETEDAGLKTALSRIRENAFSRPKRNTNGTASLQSAKDQAYPDMEFPTAEYRLLGLFRFWNIINYFYPYKNLIDEPWDDILSRFIVRFEANKDAAEYQLTTREMVAQLRDSHGAARSPSRKGAERLGQFYPPFRVRFIEKQTVVTAAFDESPRVKIGDALLSVDDEPVEKRRKRFAIYISASTPQALNRLLDDEFLRGSKDSKVKMTVRGTNGETRSVEVTRTIPANDPRRPTQERSGPAFNVLPSGYGYVDLGRLQRAEIPPMFAAIMKTPATIFDIRGYPNATIWALAPRLTEKKMPVAALISRPIWTAADLANPNLPLGANYTFAHPVPPNSEGGEIYKGKVVVLINEDAISQAEHSCLFFEAATDVTFIGTPTMGANGDVTSMVLPGNISVSFTGNEVRHADGRQLQRWGIQPHLRVEPTIRGLVENRDEILDTAIEFLEGKKYDQQPPRS